MNSRISVECAQCHNTCCKECLVKYFNGTQSINCMFCTSIFAEDHLYATSGTFREILQCITKNKLYDEEAALFNSTHQLANMYNSMQNPISKKQFLENLPDVLQEGDRQASLNVIRQCPSTSCSGHYMLGNYKCTCCKSTICEICGDIQSSDHVCDADVMKSLAIVNKCAKNCPKCGVHIEKVDGCDQMFCTNCKTAFDWITLRVISTGIENPHYFEWLRSQNGSVDRDINDIPCGGLPTYQNVYQANEAFLKNAGIDRKSATYNLNATTLLSFQAFIEDIQGRVIPNHLQSKDNTDLRIRYMCGELTKSSFTTLIFKRHNCKVKTVQKLQIYQMIRDAGTDILQRWTTDIALNQIGRLKNIVEEIDELINCANLAFRTLHEKNVSKLKRLHKKIENIGYLSKYSVGHYRVGFSIQERVAF